MKARPWLLLALLAGLAACRPAEAPHVAPASPAPAITPSPAPAITPSPAPAEEAPLPQAVEAASEAILAPTVALQAALGDEIAPTPPPEPPNAACRRAAAALVVRWEVTSPAYYTRRLQWPVWPKGASGVTWGVGYDGGHQTAAVIADDWTAHTDVGRLVNTAGVTGSAAGRVLPTYRDIITPYDYAARVLEERSLVEYERRTARAFGDIYALRPNACGGLVSLVYNRGGAMTGDARKEMRAIRDTCIPAQDYACMAKEVRSMKRLWVGTVNENGLSARRESEAVLIETP